MLSNRKIAVVAFLLFLASGPGLVQAQDCAGFWENSITTGGTNGVAAVFAADIDGDGDIDIISASYNDDMIAWYESDGGTPPGFTQHVITTDADGVTFVYAVDIDNDGDVDILAAAPYADEIALYQNIGGNPPGFFKTVLSASANHAISVFAADVDGDGDIDPLSASYADNTIAWYENPEIENLVLNPDGGSGTYIKHDVTTNANRAYSVHAGDMDGDGDTDILSASAGDGEIAWHMAELDEELHEILFTEYPVALDLAGARAVRAADIDSDGDLDAVAAASGDNMLAWYESDIDTDDSGNPDLDSDGEPDDSDGPLAFTENVITTTAEGVNSIHVVDIDSDGHLDILASSGESNTIAWYRNDGDPNPTFAEHLISDQAESADSVFAADIDGDGNIDALSASSVPGPISRNDKIAWYENDGSAPPDWTEQVVSETSEGSNALFAGDIDTDADFELISATTSGKIVWYDVEIDHDSSGGYDPPVFTRHLIADDVPGASSVFAQDLDGDGDQDVVAASADRDRILWYANSDASPGTFEAGRVITNNAISVESVFIADVDADGDPDLLSASSGDDKIAWYESDGGNPPSFTERAISSSDPELSPYSTAGAKSVFATDLDGDEYIDILSASSGDDKIAWFEWASDLPDDGWLETIIASDDPGEAIYRARGASSVAAADIDGDGDEDVLAASSHDNIIAWYEQRPDAVPMFQQHVISSSADLAVFVTAADIDGDIDTDDDLDVLSAAVGNDEVAWYEQYAGSTSDLVLFTKHAVDSTGANPSTILARDVNGDGLVDLIVGYRFKVSWYERIGELCRSFNVNDQDDSVIDGIELAWVGRAFGQSSENPEGQWWYPVDFNQDGFVDGDDLAILADPGVWGMHVDECVFTCK
jgi:hypothetical protein